MYFLIGIKGKGMLSLAKFLFDMGVKVEGYDDNCEKDSNNSNFNSVNMFN